MSAPTPRQVDETHDPEDLPDGWYQLPRRHLADMDPVWGGSE